MFSQYCFNMTLLFIILSCIPTLWLECSIEIIHTLQKTSINQRYVPPTNSSKPICSSFCIIQNFLPFCGRILPALKKKSKISGRLSDRSEVTQHKINFVKNCPYLGLNPQPPDHQSHALPSVLSHYFVVCVNH